MSIADEVARVEGEFSYAIEQAIANGIPIRRGSFGITYKKFVGFTPIKIDRKAPGCCAIGAAAILPGDDTSLDLKYYVGLIYGCTPESVDEVIVGFDMGNRKSAWHAMGARLAKKYVTK